MIVPFVHLFNKFFFFSECLKESKTDIILAILGFGFCFFFNLAWKKYSEIILNMYNLNQWLWITVGKTIGCLDMHNETECSHSLKEQCLPGNIKGFLRSKQIIVANIKE